MSDDLIKRSDAIKAVLWGNGLDGSVVDDICEKIDAIPSADRPSAVDLSSVYSTAYKSGYEKGKADRPQGEWQYVYKGKWMLRRCSCCDWAQTYDDSKYMGYRYNFCPNCGARMKGADDE